MISTNPSIGDRTLVLVPISTENAVRMITHKWELAWGKHRHKGKNIFFFFLCLCNARRGHFLHRWEPVWA